MLLHVLTCLLLWLHPSPRDVARLQELEQIAVEVATTDAADWEAELLAAICIHETGCVAEDRIFTHKDGLARGPWQVRGEPSAREALRRVRWSWAACGDLSLYAGCGGCGRCPGIVRSLTDPTVPRL